MLDDGCCTAGKVQLVSSHVSGALIGVMPATGRAREHTNTPPHAVLRHLQKSRLHDISGIAPLSLMRRDGSLMQSMLCPMRIDLFAMDRFLLGKPMDSLRARVE